jgi:hypothetical protein
MGFDTSSGKRGSADCALSAAATLGLALSILLSFAAMGTGPARALPSFAVQTSQPCAACHIGAFGPQLTPAGRDFKLHGYIGSDGQEHGLPLALVTQSSFTHTAVAQASAPAPGFSPNDNVALDSVAVYYAGQITSEVGTFAKFRYNVIRGNPQLGALDIRRAGEGELFGRDVLWGITANNSPTVQDPWNSTPAWGFPYLRSALAPGAIATPLVSGGLSQKVAGVGVYTLWSDLIFIEADVYKGLDADALRAVGQIPVDGGDHTATFMPYARLAVIRDWQNHHLEIGAFGLSANVVPGRNQTFGLAVRKTDLALDATYQYITDPARVTSDRLSAHASYIHEAAGMETSPFQARTGELLDHALDTTRVDISYSFAATFTPSIQYFRTTGTTDIKFWATPNGSPNSDGMIFELAYVPWGKPDLLFPNLNFRLVGQYVNYFALNGSATNARGNNVFFGFQTAGKF